MPAGDLRAGEQLVTLNGNSTSTVAWVHVVPGQADMYNLTVASDHTYAVGRDKAVVHNVGGEGCLNSPGQVHIDSNGQPIGVDTSEFTGTQTMNGGIRDPQEFWKAYLEKYPSDLSPSNTAGILGPRFRAPVVDDVWVLSYPEHSSYMGEGIS